MKKFIFALLLIVATCVCFPLSAFAEGNISPNPAYSPAEKYTVGETVRIKLSEVFIMGEDEEAEYSVICLCDGKPVGEISGGWLIWEPQESGIFTISFTATIKSGETATNNLRFRINKAEEIKQKEEKEESGCGSAINTVVLPAFAALAVFGLFLRQEHK